MRVIAGSARRLTLITPPGDTTRPTGDKIKETLFNILQPDLPGCRFLDLFSGSGGIGIEALSRGAEEAVFAERDRRALDCIKENLRHTKLFSQATVLEGDVFNSLAKLIRTGSAFDVIFMDPPYGQGLEEQVLSVIAGSPILSSDSILVVETELDRDMSYAEGLGYEIYRIKAYKSSQHVFLRIKE